MEGAYRVARNEFSYRPSLTLEQFLKPGYAERKIIFLCDLTKLCKRKHSELERLQKDSKSARRSRPEVLSSSERRRRSGKKDGGAEGAAPAQARKPTQLARSSTEDAPSTPTGAGSDMMRGACSTGRHGGAGRKEAAAAQRSMSAPPARPVLLPPKSTPVRARWADGMRSPVSCATQALTPAPGSPTKPLSPTRSANDLRERRGMERWVHVSPNQTPQDPPLPEPLRPPRSPAARTPRRTKLGCAVATGKRSPAPR